MKNLLYTYGAYKATSRGDNSGAGKYLLMLFGVVAVGFMILKGIVSITGNEALYGIVGSVLLSILKWSFILFVGLLLFFVLLYILKIVFIVVSIIWLETISFFKSIFRSKPGRHRRKRRR
ncbi:hypothetical protein [Oceanobacillus halotolerans]|uniref:hypothetical protein n=1 Tax=Oceanobacillus halotolerans TaxID=2663380 RepID=UPI0013D94F8B|nr:hypothetical protein [Oceanobacillus halotolerans]